MDRCPNCGATVRAGAKFCTTCGMRLPEAAAPAPEADAPSRSPFDSTSTVASRWPTRSPYDSAESSATDMSTSVAADEPAEAESTSSTTDTTSDTGSTWGAWTAPAPAVEEPEPEPSAGAEQASEVSTWGESVETPSEPAANEVEAAEQPVASEEPAASSWGRTGETDFLQLPEQPDPAAWRSIESELASAPSGDEDGLAAEAETGETVDAAIDEVMIDEETGDEVETVTVISHPSVDRAYELLDELRAIIVQLPAQAEPGEPAVESPAGVSVARASEDEVARFAELRTAIEAAQSQPRDIGTMLDISGRLDAILELHDAFLRLNDAASGSPNEGGTDESAEG